MDEMFEAIQVEVTGDPPTPDFEVFLSFKRAAA
jgi:hypothetical protein